MSKETPGDLDSAAGKRWLKKIRGGKRRDAPLLVEDPDKRPTKSFRTTLRKKILGKKQSKKRQSTLLLRSVADHSDSETDSYPAGLQTDIPSVYDETFNPFSELDSVPAEVDTRRWCDIADTKTLKSLSSKGVKRQEMILELFQTEAGFVRHLALLDIVFRRPLQEANVLDEDTLGILFSNLNQVAQMNVRLNELMMHLHNQANGGIVDAVGQQCVLWFREVEVQLYSSFCANQKNAIDIYHTLMQSNQSFAQIMEHVHHRPECSRLRFPDFVAKVFQRLSKYPLLLQGILKTTPKDSIYSAERVALEECIQYAKTILSCVDDAVRIEDDWRRVNLIQRQLDFSSADRSLRALDLTLHRRSIIREGSLSIITNNSSKDMSDVYVILFSDVILFTQSRQGQFLLKCPSLSKKHRGPVLLLKDAFVRPDAVYDKGFILINKSAATMYQLVAMTKKRREEWMRDIEATMKLGHNFKLFHEGMAKSPSKKDMGSRIEGEDDSGSEDSRASFSKLDDDSFESQEDDSPDVQFVQSVLNATAPSQALLPKNAKYSRREIVIRKEWSKSSSNNHFGALLSKTTSEVPEYLREGIFVDFVMENSIAELSGLKRGDVIMRINSESIAEETAEEITTFLRNQLDQIESMLVLRPDVSALSTLSKFKHRSMSARFPKKRSIRLRHKKSNKVFMPEGESSSQISDAEAEAGESATLARVPSRKSKSRIAPSSPVKTSLTVNTAPIIYPDTPEVSASPTDLNSSATWHDDERELDEIMTMSVEDSCTLLDTLDNGTQTQETVHSNTSSYRASPTHMLSRKASSYMEEIPEEQDAVKNSTERDAEGVLSDKEGDEELKGDNEQEKEEKEAEIPQNEQQDAEPSQPIEPDYDTNIPEISDDEYLSEAEVADAPIISHETGKKIGEEVAQGILQEVVEKEVGEAVEDAVDDIANKELQQDAAELKDDKTTAVLSSPSPRKIAREMTGDYGFGDSSANQSATNILIETIEEDGATQEEEVFVGFGLHQDEEDGEEEDEEDEEEDEEEEEDQSPQNVFKQDIALSNFDLLNESSPSKPIKIVLDIGACFLRIGFANEEVPRNVLPSILVRKETSSSMPHRVASVSDLITEVQHANHDDHSSLVGTSYLVPTVTAPDGLKRRTISMDNIKEEIAEEWEEELDAVNEIDSSKDGDEIDDVDTDFEDEGEEDKEKGEKKEAKKQNKDGPTSKKGSAKKKKNKKSLSKTNSNDNRDHVDDKEVAEAFVDKPEGEQAHGPRSKRSPSASQFSNPAFSPGSKFRKVLLSTPLKASVKSTGRAGEQCSLSFPLTERDAVNMLCDWEGIQVLVEALVSSILPPGAHSSILALDHVAGSLECVSKHRWKMAEMLYSLRSTNVGSVAFVDQALLSCLGAERRSALVVHVGETFVQVVPVVRPGGAGDLPEPLLYAAQSSEDAGAYVTSLLKEELQYQSTLFENCTQEEFSSRKTDIIIRDIKEKCCFVSLDYFADLQSCAQSSALEIVYRLPGRGNVEVSLGAERFRCYEKLFDKKNENSIPRLVMSSLELCPPDVAEELTSNIVLSGGATLAPNFVQRLERELQDLGEGKLMTVVQVSSERDQLPWVGGSIAFQTQALQNHLIPRTEFEKLPQIGEGPTLFSRVSTPKWSLSSPVSSRPTSKQVLKRTASMENAGAALPSSFMFDVMNLKGKAAIVSSQYGKKYVKETKNALTAVREQIMKLKEMEHELQSQLRSLGSSSSRNSLVSTPSMGNRLAVHSHPYGDGHDVHTLPTLPSNGSPLKKTSQEFSSPGGPGILFKAPPTAENQKGMKVTISMSSSSSSLEVDVDALRGMVETENEESIAKSKILEGVEDVDDPFDLKQNRWSMFSEDTIEGGNFSRRESMFEEDTPGSSRTRMSTSTLHTSQGPILLSTHEEEEELGLQMWLKRRGLGLVAPALEGHVQTPSQAARLSDEDLFKYGLRDDDMRGAILRKLSATIQNERLA